MNTIPLKFKRHPEDLMRERATGFKEELSARRSVRSFSSAPIPLDVVRTAIHAAGQAPSGANKQPWTFALITDPQVKRDIRAAAEAEERQFYEGRAPQDWLDDLAPLGTDANKAFLEEAPALIVVFAQVRAADGGKHYYVKESVGIATGALLAALQVSGLATLTHTPSPMAFLGEVLGRPEHEKAYMLIPVGYPSEECRVPDIHRKALTDILIEY